MKPHPDANDDDSSITCKTASWRKGWSTSSELLLAFIEGVCYEQEFDATLRNGIRNRKAAMEMVEYAQFKEKIDPIVAAVTAERASEPGSSEGVQGSRASSSPAEGAGTTLTDEDHGILTALSAEAKQKRDADVQGEKLASFKETWRYYAKRRVDAVVSLFSEPQTESQLKQLISQTDLAHSEGVPKSDYVACVFTCGLSSEAITDPHERGAPFKKARL